MANEWFSSFPQKDWILNIKKIESYRSYEDLLENLFWGNLKTFLMFIALLTTVFVSR